MPTLRLHPLLIAGAACLTLAACGSDDDPPASQAKAPATSSQPAPPSPLDDYVDGGAPATEQEAADIRRTLTGFQQAVGRQDVLTVCNLTVGLPVKSSRKSPMSCESLTADGLAEPPNEENLRLIASSKVLVGNDRATAELVPGFKMPLRKVDDRWRIDYAAINGASGSSR